MRNKVRYHKLIAVLVSIVSVPVVGAQESSTERLFIDTKVPVQQNLESGLVVGDIELKTSPPDFAAIVEETGIMAKVLEESLDNADIENWKVDRGPSLAFGQSGSGHIRNRYIPSVGIIFTVPVSFPIRSSAEYSETEDESKPDGSDLWEKHQKSSARFQVRKKVLNDRNAQIRDVRIISSDPVIVKERVKLREGDRKKSSTGSEVSSTSSSPSPVNLNIASDDSERSFGGRGNVFIAKSGEHGEAVFDAQTLALDFVGESQVFDQEKVTKLRTTLLDTVAQYGHRMEHLPPEERILIIVESNQLSYSGGIPVLSEVPMLGTFFQGPNRKIPAPGRTKARFQMVLQKQNLTESTTAEALKDKIEEIEY